MTEFRLSGWWEGKTHHYPLRVYYADTDAAGVVYHGTYLDFAERARTEMMRLLASEPTWRPGDRRSAFVVRACEIDYKRSAMLDDLLTVRSCVVALGGASFRIGQEIWRDHALLVRLGLTLVCVRDVGRPVRIPAGLREKMTGLLS